jgi:hypothetical protein
MKIQEIEGKATLTIIECDYAMLDDNGVLYWFDKKTHEKTMPVNLACINAIAWQPFKEIRPEKAGELWISEQGFYYHTEMRVLDLILVGSGGGINQQIPVLSDRDFSKWTCLFPEVPNENEIIAKGVTWERRDDWIVPIGIENDHKLQGKTTDIKLTIK